MAMKGPADCANERRKKVRMPASAQREIQRLQVVHADRIGIDCSAFVASLMLMVRRSNAEIRQKPRHGMCDREALARRVAGRAGPAGAAARSHAVAFPFNRLPASGVPRLPSIKWLVRYYPDARMRGEREEMEMKRFASSLVLASALAVTALSPAEARHHRPHFVFARIGAGVCDGVVCTGAFFATLPAACGLVMVPSTTRFVRPVRQVVCPSGLGVTMYRMIR
jgi:hypothetical protein